MRERVKERRKGIDFCVGFKGGQCGKKIVVEYYNGRAQIVMLTTVVWNESEEERERERGIRFEILVGFFPAQNKIGVFTTTG